MSNALDDLSKAATPGEWSYRPLKYDDWGTIRGGRLEDDEIGACWPPVAMSKPLWKDYDFDAHRRAKTDPMEANGRFIVALVNAYRAGELVAMREGKDAEFAADHIRKMIKGPTT